MIGSHLLLELAFGSSTGFKLFKAVCVLMLLAIVPLGVLLVISVAGYQEMAIEMSYKRQFGENWKARYEQEQGRSLLPRSRPVIRMPGQ